MIDVLAAGKLFGAPQKRTSKNGNAFVTAKLRVAMGDEHAFINLICFRETVGAALLALADGATISVAGEMKASVYKTKDGTHRVSLDVNVHEILTAFHVSRRRQSMKDGATGSERPARNQPPANATAGQEDFNDEIPF